MKVETREVLAGAYVSRAHMSRSMLSHAVAVDDAGRDVAVLCGRVDLDNLADRFASDPAATPSCPICVRRMGGHLEPCDLECGERFFTGSPRCRHNRDVNESAASLNINIPGGLK